MNPSEEQKGTSGPPAGVPSPAGSAPSGTPDALKPNLTPFQAAEPPVQPAVPLDSYQDGYPHDPPPKPPAPPPPVPVQAVATRPRRPGGGGKTPPPPPPPPGGGGDDEDDGMLRMSFLEHLEELRTRIIRALMGVAVAFGLSLFY